MTKKEQQPIYVSPQVKTIEIKAQTISNTDKYEQQILTNQTTK